MNTIDPPTDFFELSDDKQLILLLICKRYFQPSNKPNTKYTSYQLKEMIDHNWGMFCTNGQFKGAMLKLGFYSDDIGEAINCHFNVSDRSKAIQIHNEFQYSD